MGAGELERSRLTRRVALVALASAGLLAMLAVRAPWMNGPWYWKWRWQYDVPLGAAAIALLAAAAPLAAALILWRRRSIGVLAALLLMMASSFALQLSAIGIQEPQVRLSRTVDVVLDARGTGYLQTAAQVTSTGEHWLARFPELSVTNAVAPHAKTKPPGWVAFYATLLFLFPQPDGGGDPRVAAVVGGLLAGLLAALAIPAVHLLVEYFSRDRDTAILGAAVMALAPAMVVWFPQFDPTYPAVTCLWIVLWAMAIDRGRARDAVAAGGVIAGSLFVAYNFLVLGALLAGYTLVAVRLRRTTVARAARQAGLAIGTIVLGYVLTWWATGFDALETFAQALGSQQAMLELTRDALPRPYPQTILFDLTDFAMASAWITLLPAAFWLADRVRARDWSDPFPIAALGVGQLLVVAATGLLAAETFRVWIFMLPLVVLPAALELRRWPWRASGAFLVCVWLLTLAIVNTMAFV